MAVSLFLVGCSQQEESQATGTKETTPSTQEDTATQKDMNKQADMAASQSKGQEVAAAEEQVSTDTSSAANGQGQEICRKNCASCQDTGVSGAPQLGAQSAWKSHVAKGRNHLVTSVVDGKGQMPPKGGNPSLSEVEIQAAVDYMVSQVE